MLCTYYTQSSQPCADGSRFDARAMTCASRQFALGEWLVLTTKDGRRAFVKVTDYTPRGHRNLDLTPAAFRRLYPKRDWRAVGVLHVRVRRLGGRQ